MTSQLILANGHGIALASDSAVTMGNRRTFETSEKIYPLAMPHRLAVMHAGNVMFHGLPFGTIINEWIDSLGTVRLRYVHLYQESFNSWLLDNYHCWSTEQQLYWDVLHAFNLDFERIWNRLRRLEDPSNAEMVAAVWRMEIDSAERFDPATPDSKRVAETEFGRLWPRGSFDGKGIQDSLDYWFDDVAMTDEIEELVMRYVKASIESRYPNSDSSFAHLMFVGYGNNEMLPAACAMEVYGAIPNLLYSLRTGHDEGRREGYGTYLVRPSGQYDAIDLIFRGFDYGFIEATKTAVTRALEKSPDALGSDDSPKNAVSKFDSVIEDSFYDYSESKKLRGLRRSIAGMPLASLVRTVKSLIEVQRLSLDIAGELQTVGGQVDVGLITLKDGFKWVRQKEYGDYVD